MAIISTKSTSNYHIRSVSLPSKTHPTTQTVEEELNRLKSWEQASSSTSAGSICYSLTGLQELYQCIDDLLLLNLPSTINALSRQRNHKCVNGLLDISVKSLDMCGMSKDLVSQCKENVRDLQSTLRRRRKGSNSAIETGITDYFVNRRQMRRDAKRSLMGLKQIEQEINDFGPVMVDLENYVSSVIKVLQEENSISISIFQAVLKFLSVRTYMQKIKKWTIVARLVQKEKVGSEDQQIKSLNELENADAALCCICENDQPEMEQFQFVRNRLQILEGSLEGIENQLDSTFRCLVRSRTTILNVLSF